MATSKPVRKTAKTRVAPARASKDRLAPGAASNRRTAASGSDDGSLAASEKITARISELADWRGDTLALVRKLVHEADSSIVEEWKWQTPVWSHDGIVCTGESYKQTVKLTFAKGAFLADPQGLFNAGLTGNVRRAIDLRDGDSLEASAFRELVREAVAFNRDRGRKGGRG